MSLKSIENGGVVLGKAEAVELLRLDRANRHGIVAGATGTGKTVTLQIMAQAFSDAGVPVFAADVKGDLSGIAVAGTPNEKLIARAQSMDVDLTPVAAPVIFWDLFGEKGHPIRATVSEMGPMLLSRLFELNDVQEGVLSIAFRVADEEGLLLLDLADLRAVLAHVGENAKAIGLKYGNVAPASIGALQRELLTLEDQGGGHFFGEPALKLEDLMRVGGDGRGQVSILAADRLIQSPRVYATFLLWLLSELFEQLPEVGDLDKPRLVFFFDEAHLLFRDAPRGLLEKIEQVVRLIRSKGVGVYFVTQNPADVPDTVLAQLGARVQHALRAYTPAEQKGLKAAADSFRPNPAFDTAEAIQQLGVGEALVSTLDEKGVPSVVARTLIRPPSSRLGPITPAERAQVMAQSPVRSLYDAPVDRESAYERLTARAAQAQNQQQAAQQQTAAERAREDAAREADREIRQAQRNAPRYQAPRAPRPSNRQSAGEAFGKSLVRSVGSGLGRALLRGILGGLSR
jgi:DNA helicase HerA-like ATPase